MMRFDIIDECESAVFEALCTISTLSMFWVQHVQRVPLWGKFFVWMNVREKVVTTPFRGKMAEILNIPIFYEKYFTQCCAKTNVHICTGNKTQCNAVLMESSYFESLN